MQAENADSAGLNRFPIWPATFARSAAHEQYSIVAVNVRARARVRMSSLSLAS